MVFMLQPENIFVVLSGKDEPIIKIADFDTSHALERDATAASMTNIGVLSNFNIFDHTVDAIKTLRTLSTHVTLETDAFWMKQVAQPEICPFVFKKSR